MARPLIVSLLRSRESFLVEQPASGTFLTYHRDQGHRLVGP
ncbi:hypothetical protein [Streptomyces sp. NPDC047123]